MTMPTPEPRAEPVTAHERLELRRTRFTIGVPAVLALHGVVLLLMIIFLSGIRNALEVWGAPGWLLEPWVFAVVGLIALIAALGLLFAVLSPVLTAAALARSGVELSRRGVTATVPWHDVAGFVMRSDPTSALSRYGLVGLRVLAGSASAENPMVRRALGRDPEALHWVGRVRRDRATVCRVSQLSGGRLEQL